MSELKEIITRLRRVDQNLQECTLDLIRMRNKIRQDKINREEIKRGTSKRTLSK
jgi:hypothetical protein